MNKCIICGKEHQDTEKYCIGCKEYKDICHSCYDKLNNLDNDELSIWVQRMLEIDNITDEGRELLKNAVDYSIWVQRMIEIDSINDEETDLSENAVANRHHKLATFQGNAKWSKLFSLILTFIGLVTVAVGLGLGFLLYELIEDEAIFIIIGGVVGVVLAIIEIAFGKVVAEIGENIAAIRSNLNEKYWRQMK